MIEEGSCVEQIIILPCDTAWDVACAIINAKCTGVNLLGQETEIPYFDLVELRRIGEHIVNYCNTESGGGEDA